MHCNKLYYINSVGQTALYSRGLVCGKVCGLLFLLRFLFDGRTRNDVATDRMHSYRHAALSEISRSRIGLWGNITHSLISHTIFLLVWGLKILLFGQRDRLVLRRSMEYQLCKDNARNECKVFFCRQKYRKHGFVKPIEINKKWKSCPWLNLSCTR